MGTVYFIIGQLLDRILLPRIYQLAFSDRIILLLTACFLGSMILWNLGFEVPDRYLFLPSGSLQLTNTGEANARSSDTKVVLKLFETGTTDSFSALKQEGAWQLQDGTAWSAMLPPVSAGTGGFRELRITLRTGPDMGVEGSDQWTIKQLDLADPYKRKIPVTCALPALNRI